MALSYPAGANTFVPKYQDGLLIGWARNPKSFAINRYMEIRKVDRPAGLYARIEPNEGGRARNNDLRMAIWPDSADRPRNTMNNKRFEFVPYRTTRINVGFDLGYKAAEYAEWDLRGSHIATAGQQVMTFRTVNALDVLTQGFPASGVGSGNTADVDGGLLTAGKNWGNGSETAPYILDSLTQGAQVIEKQTMGVINQADNVLILVISPNDARKMAVSAEVHSYLARSQFAQAVLRDENNWNRQYYLPPEMYGFPIVVENCVVENSHPGNTVNPLVDPTYGFNGGTAYLLAFPAGQTGNIDKNVEVTEVKSSLVGFYVEEMAVEMFDDPRNRRYEGNIVEDYQIQLTSPLSAFRFTKTMG